ncbi:MAG: hypothetical protein LBI18_08840 [Planctomycetaceae bacterium]|nr:hypothetical protein [Planctomycetaceae bacterium]
MKKLLTFVIVFSLALILHSMNVVAQESVAAEKKFVPTLSGDSEGVAQSVVTEEVPVIDGNMSGCCVPVPCRPCAFRPFVRRACTPCVATPCNPCPPCAPQPPICAPVSRPLCAAPIQPPCQVEQTTCSPCGADAYGYGCGYAGYRSGPLRNFFARLFSRMHSGCEPYYGYDVHEFGYGANCPCHCEH